MEKKSKKRESLLIDFLLSVVIAVVLLVLLRAEKIIDSSLPSYLFLVVGLIIAVGIIFLAIIKWAWEVLQGKR